MQTCPLTDEQIQECWLEAEREADAPESEWLLYGQKVAAAAAEALSAQAERDNERRLFADCPLDMFSWMERDRPEWVAMYRSRGAMVKVPEMMVAWGAWNAAIEAVMRLLYEAPIRELHGRVWQMMNVARA